MMATFRVLRKDKSMLLCAPKDKAAGILDLYKYATEKVKLDEEDTLGAFLTISAITNLGKVENFSKDVLKVISHNILLLR